MDTNTPFNFIQDLTQDREEKTEKSCERRACFPKPPRPRDPPIRPSHLKARQRFPTHPLIRISKKLPRKLPTMAELEKLTPEQLAARFLKQCHKFK